MSPCFLAAGSPEAMFFLGGIVSCQMRIIFDRSDQFMDIENVEIKKQEI